jgi:hypothetical protein
MAQFRPKPAFLEPESGYEELRDEPAAAVFAPVAGMARSPHLHPGDIVLIALVLLVLPPSPGGVAPTRFLAFGLVAVGLALSGPRIALKPFSAMPASAVTESFPRLHVCALLGRKR